MTKTLPALVAACAIASCSRPSSESTVDAVTSGAEAAVAVVPQVVPEAASSPAGPKKEAAHGPRLYVTNEGSGDVTVIDTAQNVVANTIPIGKRPRGIRRSPAGDAVYVALSGSVPMGPNAPEDATPPPADKSADGIGIIDTSTGAMVGKLPSGSDPEQLSLSLDGKKVYVSNEDASELSVLDLATRTVERSFPVGEEPEGVATSPDGKWVYVTCEATNAVHVLDVASGKMVAKLTVGARPRAADFLPDSSAAYVTSETGGTVTVVALPKHQIVKTLKLVGENVRPMGIVVSPDGTTAYVSTGHGGTVVVIDTKTRTVKGSIAVGKRPWGIAIAADGKTLYTANGVTNDVSVVDTAAMKETSRITVGSKPWGLVLVP